LPTEPKSARAAGAGSAGAAGPAERQLLLDALAEGPGRKRDLLDRSGLDESDWSTTIKALTEDGLAKINGTTYSLIEE
jgi:DNA-binding IclR family transcriptional regulator